ncbi:MAG: AraC family transcriptional regulator [Prevotella sp.]|jgi:AraC-like DNA-binding protein|nr:AraC family transcriptional regulator [Prevotella sp.]
MKNENNEPSINAREEIFHLEVNEVMEKYLDMLHTCYRAGLRCRYYNEGKIRELMYILRSFYSREMLRDLFSPALSADTEFTRQFMEVYSRYGSLREIATVMNYTLSGFEKKFRKVFGCSPYNWILRQKAQEVLHQVKTSNLNLKVIADDFGFSSVAALNNFLKKRFGITPGQARKNK